jgi:hypothetical protein
MQRIYVTGVIEPSTMLSMLNQGIVLNMLLKHQGEKRSWAIKSLNNV